MWRLWMRSGCSRTTGEDGGIVAELGKAVRTSHAFLHGEPFQPEDAEKLVERQIDFSAGIEVGGGAGSEHDAVSSAGAEAVLLVLIGNGGEEIVEVLDA
ncbi:MAG: hypothetical protein R3F31_00915 [Verrucomicrobiales bacterium]